MRRCIVGLLTTTTLLACDGASDNDDPQGETLNDIQSAGQTGGEVQSDPGDADLTTGGTTGNAAGEDGFGCEPRPQVLASADTESALGFSANDILEFAEGVHQAEVIWNDLSALSFPSDVSVSLGPETGTGEITLEIEYSGGEVRYVETEASTPDDGTEVGLLGGSSCPTYLEIDVNATLSTAGGALAEAFPTTLRATTSYLAELSYPFEFEDLMGDLELSVSGGENAELVQFSVEAELAAGLFRGNIGGILQQSNEMVASAAPLELASWGPEPCELGGTPVPLDAQIGGFTPADLLAVINDSPALDVTWADGSQAELTLGVDTDEAFACLGGAFQPEQVVLIANVSVSSDDGRVASELGVDLFGRFPGGEQLAEVELIFNAAFTKAVPVADFETAFGITGANLEDYETATINLQSVWDLSDDSVSGTLEVLGLSPAMCNGDPEPPPDITTSPDSSGEGEPGDPALSSAGTTPGCAGLMSTSVDSATW